MISDNLLNNKPFKYIGNHLFCVPFQLMTDAEDQLVELVHQEVTVTEHYDIIEHLQDEGKCMTVVKLPW